MDNNNNHNFLAQGDSRSNTTETLNLRRTTAAYIRRWPIFLLSILFFLLISWVYVRYLTPIYKSSIKVLVKDEKKNPGTDILLRGLATKADIYGGIDNEIEIMKSFEIMKQVVDELDITNTYYRKGKIINIEAYGSGLPILLKSYKSEKTPHGLTLEVEYNKPNILINSGGKTIKTQVNKAFKIGNNVLTFYNNPRGKKIPHDEFTVSVSSNIGKAKQLQGAISINLVNEYSSVLTLSLNGKNTQKNEDILTKIISVYNIDSKKDKTAEFDKTTQFIEERIEILDKELSNVEDNKQNFKQKNKIANLADEVRLNIQQETPLRNQLLNTETQLSLVQTYKNYIKKQPVETLLPIDISNSNNSSTISGYNSLVVERNNKLASGATKDHPTIINLERQIEDVKSNILTNIRQQELSLTKNKNSILSELNKTVNFGGKVPVLEKVSRDIDRQQNIKERLYILLLQKREEAEISRAIVEDKIKIIDPASSYGPVAPVKSRYFLGAIAIGLLLPFIIIFIQELLKNKIETRGDLEDLIKGEPIIAEIPKISIDEEFSLVGSDLSIMSEAFRIMRTNIEFVIDRRLGKSNEGKVLLVTSSIKGEGKTLVSMNYAHVLGQLKGKKAIIIGADIRNPQLHRYDRVSKKAIGLTEYLHDETISIDQIVNISKSDNKTRIIFSGRIPPNPTELLMSNRFTELVESLRKDYDYVVIDSAPLVLVSDTYHISNNADMTVYVTRSEFTPKDVIRVPMDAMNEGRIKNVVFALNDISTAHSGYAYGYKYNYGYGYGYGTKNRKRSLIKRIFASFR